MPWRGPEYEGEFPSLGYTLLEQYAEYLRVPSGPMVGQPLVPTDEQARFIINFYRVDPETEQFFYRRGYLRRPKGWGKSPILGAWAIGEFCMESVFGGWDANGEPIGKPHGSPWVQVAACSEDQTDNTYVALMEMLSESPAVDELGLEVMHARVQIKGRPGSRLEPVTASAGSREGQPVTAAVLDETHLWLPNNGGVKLAATIRRNVAKMDGRSVESTNAWVPGQQSVAEQTETAKGRGQKGLLLDVGPQVDLKPEDLKDRVRSLKALELVYGDSEWVRLDRIYEDATDADTDVADALRFYWNMIVKGSEQAFDVKQWAKLANLTTIGAKELIVVGFDGARFRDSTGLIATHVEGAYQWKAGVWEEDGSQEWEVPVLEVEGVLESLFDTYDIWRFYGDPWYWETQINIDWPAKWGEKIVAWDTRQPKKMAYALRSFVAAMRASELTHDGDSDYARHIANARRRDTQMFDTEGRRLWVIQKEHDSSPNKIDLAMAGVLSWEARRDCIAAGGNKKRSNTLITF